MGLIKESTFFICIYTILYYIFKCFKISWTISYEHNMHIGHISHNDQSMNEWCSLPALLPRRSRGHQPISRSHHDLTVRLEEAKHGDTEGRTHGGKDPWREGPKEGRTHGGKDPWREARPILSTSSREPQSSTSRLTIATSSGFRLKVPHTFPCVSAQGARTQDSWEWDLWRRPECVE